MSDSTNTPAEVSEAPNYIGTATYSVEDNKLRLSAFRRLSQADYDRVKAAGFKWAPKQEIFVAPMWTPSREDLLLELCGEIDDEDYSALERSADRADRFEGYREKRTAEAIGHADTFDAGPSAFGHQNAARAQRQANRHDRHRAYASNQWAKAEYWQTRTAAVIAHALYKADPTVRRGRILRLEAEQRKHEKSRTEYAERFAAWQKVLTLEGCNTAIVRSPEGKIVDATPAMRLAYTLANTGYGNYQHPRHDYKDSLYSLLVDSYGKTGDPLTPAECANLFLAGRTEAYADGCGSNRWSDHYANRLTYERAMLANEGGTAAAVEMVVGGWINTGNRTGSVFTDVAKGWKQIHAITKSPATKRVTSVKVMGLVGYSNPKPGLVSVNIERLPEGSYRAPTAEELEAFSIATKERKKAEKTSKPKEPSLINPTLEDAQRLQAIFNAKAKTLHEKHNRYTEFKPAEVLQMTQEQYSARSKGSYATLETRTLYAEGKISRRDSNMWTRDDAEYAKTLGKAICKIRVRDYSITQVIVITDKPQKGLDWDAIEGTAEVTATITPSVVVTEPEPEPIRVENDAQQLLFA